MHVMWAAASSAPLPVTDTNLAARPPACLPPPPPPPALPRARRPREQVIALERVTDIRKKKHIGFPNSIEVTCDGKREFFASFMAREEAFRCVCMCG